MGEVLIGIFIVVGVLGVLFSVADMEELGIPMFLIGAVGFLCVFGYQVARSDDEPQQAARSGPRIPTGYGGTWSGKVRAPDQAPKDGAPRPAAVTLEAGGTAVYRGECQYALTLSGKQESGGWLHFTAKQISEDDARVPCGELAAGDLYLRVKGGTLEHRTIYSSPEVGLSGTLKKKRT
ncbi:hypothetical protein ACQEU3_39335 [Spirillospora sp. CA-253888]